MHRFCDKLEEKLATRLPVASGAINLLPELVIRLKIWSSICCDIRDETSDRRLSLAFVPGWQRIGYLLGTYNILIPAVTLSANTNRAAPAGFARR